MIFPQIRQAIPRGEYLKNIKQKQKQKNIEEILIEFTTYIWALHVP